MNGPKLSRREALVRTGLALGGASLISGETFGTRAAAATRRAAGAGAFLYSLNMGTLRGHKLGIVKEIETAASAGYDGIEPWVDALQEYVKQGGSLGDLRKRIEDAGLTVEGAIGFPEWIVDDDTKRAAGMERAKREMDLVSQIGGKRFASPPAGATNLPRLDLAQAAERYRALLEAGDQIGLVPILELWGFSKNLNSLGECINVAMETGHPKACVLADVFHMYKGGTDFRGMRLLGPTAIPVLHMNDYPSDPPRDKINDSYRVYPGDGVAPLGDILTTFHKTGGQKVLSLELFNREYWAQEPSKVARDGLAKMKAVVQKAGL